MPAKSRDDENTLPQTSTRNFLRTGAYSARPSLQTVTSSPTLTIKGSTPFSTPKTRRSSTVSTSSGVDSSNVKFANPIKEITSKSESASTDSHAPSKQTHSNSDNQDSFSSLLLAGKSIAKINTKTIYIFYLIWLWISTFIMLVTLKLNTSIYTYYRTNQKQRDALGGWAHTCFIIEGFFVILIVYSVSFLEPSKTSCQKPILLGVFAVLHWMCTIIQARLLLKQKLHQPDDAWIVFVKIVSYCMILYQLQDNLSGDELKALNKCFWYGVCVLVLTYIICLITANKKIITGLVVIGIIMIVIYIVFTIMYFCGVSPTNTGNIPGYSASHNIMNRMANGKSSSGQNGLVGSFSDDSDQNQISKLKDSYKKMKESDRKDYVYNTMAEINKLYSKEEVGNTMLEFVDYLEDTNEEDEEDKKAILKKLENNYVYKAFLKYVRSSPSCSLPDSIESPTQIDEKLKETILESIKSSQGSEGQQREIKFEREIEPGAEKMLKQLCKRDLQFEEVINEMKDSEQLEADDIERLTDFSKKVESEL